ncbi:hypothetical protein SPONN_2113 [uncultured Candidatus Thioglobus sp.]|nr:hypothetical protein SPONN_2113 [uncultured Candidatus Thioglobus sp.]
MIIKILIVALLISQPVFASPVSDGALKMIKVGNEIGSASVVTNGQFLLLKAMFHLNDFDAAYEASMQMRSGNRLLNQAPQENQANRILIKLLKQNYDPALYQSALYLLDGEGGFVRDEVRALKLLEKSVELHSNPQSAFIAAALRNESPIPSVKNKRYIDELITFAVLNQVKGASEYQKYYIDNNWRSLGVKNWRQWSDAQ